MSLSDLGNYSVTWSIARSLRQLSCITDCKMINDNVTAGVPVHRGLHLSSFRKRFLTINVTKYRGILTSRYFVYFVGRFVGYVNRASLRGTGRRWRTRWWRLRLRLSRFSVLRVVPVVKLTDDEAEFFVARFHSTRRLLLTNGAQCPTVDVQLNTNATFYSVRYILSYISEK